MLVQLESVEFKFEVKDIGRHSWSQNKNVPFSGMDACYEARM